MSELPFIMTPDAAAHIEKMLINAQRFPERLALATVFGVIYNASWVDQKGKGGGYSYPHVHVGWNRPEELDAADYIELELVGFQVLAHKRSIEFLSGKRIELEHVDKHAILAVKDDNAPKWTY
jgi:hypothetical protein